MCFDVLVSCGLFATDIPGLRVWPLEVVEGMKLRLFYDLPLLRRAIFAISSGMVLGGSCTIFNAMASCFRDMLFRIDVEDAVAQVPVKAPEAAKFC